MENQIDFQLLSFGMRRIGWIRFWTQTVLGVVVTGILSLGLINGSERDLGLNGGLVVTSFSFIVLLYSLWHSWLIVLTGRALASGARPSRGETGRLIKRGVFADLLGLVFAVVGYEALMGPLFFQAARQTSGIAMVGTGVSNDDSPINALEMLSVFSNTQVLLAHVIGLIFSLWLLQRIYRNRK